MAESSSGAGNSNSGAGELWVCINPDCDMQMPMYNKMGKQVKFCSECGTYQIQGQADRNPSPSGSTTAYPKSRTEQQQSSGVKKTSNETSATPPDHEHSEESGHTREIGEIAKPKREIENQPQGEPPQIPMATTLGSQGAPPHLPVLTHGTEQSQGDPPHLPVVTHESDQSQGAPPHLPVVTHGSDQSQGAPPHLPVLTHGTEQSQGDPSRSPMVTHGSDQLSTVAPTLTEQNLGSELSEESPKPKQPKQELESGHAPNSVTSTITGSTKMAKDIPSPPKEGSTSDPVLTSRPVSSATPGDIGTPPKETQQHRVTQSKSQEEVSQEEVSIIDYNVSLP